MVIAISAAAAAAVARAVGAAICQWQRWLRACCKKRLAIWTWPESSLLAAVHHKEIPEMMGEKGD